MRRLFADDKGDLSLTAPVEQFRADSQITSAPASAFDGVSISGWHVRGSGKWRVEHGELVGASGAGESGWLVLDHGLEDFVLKFSFRANSGEAACCCFVLP
jgi:hypothetical protein